MLHIDKHRWIHDVVEKNPTVRVPVYGSSGLHDVVEAACNTQEAQPLSSFLIGGKQQDLNDLRSQVGGEKVG